MWEGIIIQVKSVFNRPYTPYIKLKCFIIKIFKHGQTKTFLHKKCIQLYN